MPPFFRPVTSVPLPLPAMQDSACEFVGCGDNRALRQEYIDRLSEFNQAAARHNAILRAGVGGAAFENSWRTFQERCAISRAAWSRYRNHAATHGCKRA